MVDFRGVADTTPVLAAIYAISQRYFRVRGCHLDCEAECTVSADSHGVLIGYDSISWAPLRNIAQIFPRPRTESIDC